MEGHHPQHQHQHMNMMMSVNVDTTDNRFPQWSLQETREFLMIRAELDRSFMETKRNKLLWEITANKMKEKGFNRSPDQCKCKWKNLVTRYKGCEAMEPEAMRQQFPFYNELQAIFTARMQRMLWNEAEGGGSVGPTSSTRKKPGISSDEEEENAGEESDGNGGGGGARKRKKSKKSNTNIAAGSTSSSSSIGELREVLEEFMRQQMQMEERWQEAHEARERERMAKEMEWRNTMQALENERMMIDRRWREREEQRRQREEARAEKRDALITALLNKLRRDDI